MSEITYPTRCMVIDPAGASAGVGDGLVAAAPRKSLPHVGKFGTAYQHGTVSPVLHLDDGTVLRGYDCWWVPLTEEQEAEAKARRGAA